MTDEISWGAAQSAWAGGFGDAYWGRNRQSGRERHRFWFPFVRHYLDGVQSAYELGCSDGINLYWLRLAGLTVAGCDIGPGAVAQARMLGFDVEIGDARKLRGGDPTADLAFCCGVLIHQPTREDVLAVMEQLYGTATRYVLFVEHEADQDTAVGYRDDVPLVKRPFGSMFRERYNDDIAEEFSGPVEGWPVDGLTFRLYEML